MLYYNAIISTMPNPQSRRPGYPFLSGSSRLTCLAWEALPVACITTSIALMIIWLHKLHYYTKVGMPSGGCIIIVSVIYIIEDFVEMLTDKKVLGEYRHK